MKKVNIMLTDDNRSFLSGLQLYLRHSAEIKVVSTAESGEQCLAKLRCQPVDAILLDINMETPDAGLRVAETIRQKSLSPAKIIFLTAEFRNSDIQRAIGMNCSFLDKNCTVPHIIDTIKQVCLQDKLIVNISR